MEKYYKLQNILEELLKNIKRQDFLTFFRKMSILEISDEKIVFGCFSGFMKGNLEAKLYDVIFEATKKEFKNIKEIEFEVDNNIENPSNKDVIDCTIFIKNFGKQSNSFKKTLDKKIESLITKKADKNLRYTLDNFVVWPDSQLAYSASQAVSKNPWNSYNPLYIYWDVWLGKTHLLQATWNEILKKRNWKKVMYITADKFITEYIASVKKRSVEKMRTRYRMADVLIIDDVQFLAKKEQTQNELYNIFNLLYDDNKQIILSWDRSPNELTELEPRLQSRFGWGITVDIWKPDYETRLAILQEKAREKEFLLSQDIFEFIATNVTQNIRELEWVLNQLIAEYELTWIFPTLEMVAKKLNKLSFTDNILWEAKKTVAPTVTIRSYEDIIEAVWNYFWIEKEWILWTNRRKEFMIPRQVSMYLLKNKMHYTYERIGNIFSWRNHAAVLYSCKKLDWLLKKDKKLLTDMNHLRNTIWI